MISGLQRQVRTAEPSQDCKQPNMSFKESSGRVLQRDAEFNKVTGCWKSGLICHCKINGITALLLTARSMDRCFSGPLRALVLV